MKRALLLDVVIRERAAILELLAGEDKALLVGRDALLVLDLGLHVVDRVGRLDLEGDGLAGESWRGEGARARSVTRPSGAGGVWLTLDEDLHGADGWAVDGSGGVCWVVCAERLQ